MENVVAPVTSLLFPYASKPVAVYVWLPPAVIVELEGLTVMRSTAAAVTVSIWVALCRFGLVAEIVGAPALVSRYRKLALD
jgi:hypothetical protein